MTSSPPPAMSLAQVVPLVLCCLIVTIMPLWIGRKRAATESEFQLGGGFGAWSTALAILPALLSLISILGTTGESYRSGWTGLGFVVPLGLTLATVALIGGRIATIAREGSAITPADLVTARYGRAPVLALLVSSIGLIFSLAIVVVQLAIVDGMRTMFITWHPGLVVILVAALAAVAASGSARGLARILGVQASWVLATLLLTAMILAGSLLGGTPDSAPVVGPAEPISWMVLIPAAISLALQPALWLRYRAAASAGAVRRGAVIVFVLAVVGFVLVAGLIGREARALYPLRVDDQWQLNPNARVDPDGRGFDRVLPTLLVHLPTQTLRPVISAVLLSGLLAAAIATVGVNLRAIGTLFVRDIYVRAFHPRAGLGERIAVCRIISALAAAGAVFLVIISRRPDSFRPLLFVSELAFLGPALLLQLLPLTSDILTFRKGNRHAAALGLIAGLGVLALFHPVTGIVASTFVPRVGILLSQFQGQDNPAFAAIAVNLSVFVTISILAAVLNRSKSARNLLEPAKPLPTQARAAEPLTAGTEWSNREAPLSTG